MKVLFFARARDLAGIDSVDVPPVPTVVELRRVLAERFPRLASLLPHCAIAANDDFVEDTTALTIDAEVAVLPPVSGGCSTEFGPPTCCETIRRPVKKRR